MEYIRLHRPKRYTYAMVEGAKGLVKEERSLVHERGLFPVLLLEACHSRSPASLGPLGKR